MILFRSCWQQNEEVFWNEKSIGHSDKQEYQQVQNNQGRTIHGVP